MNGFWRLRVRHLEADDLRRAWIELRAEARGKLKGWRGKTAGGLIARARERSSGGQPPAWAAEALLHQVRKAAENSYRKIDL